MKASTFFEHTIRRKGLKNDSALSTYLGLTPPAISQMRKNRAELTPLQVERFIEHGRKVGEASALSDVIAPCVEMYPIERVSSKQDRKWELLPTGAKHARNTSIRHSLESEVGIYAFFDSLGRAIYIGKTEKQNLWKEMTGAFNRERADHKAYFVGHPSTGKKFLPGWEKPRQPTKKVVYLHDTAHYFSAYRCRKELIPVLEALMVRVFANTLTNKKMEKF